MGLTARTCFAKTTKCVAIMLALATNAYAEPAGKSRRRMAQREMPGKEGLKEAAREGPAARKGYPTGQLTRMQHLASLGPRRSILGMLSIYGNN